MLFTKLFIFHRISYHMFQACFIMPPICTYMKCLLSWSAKMLSSAALCRIRTYN